MAPVVVSNHHHYDEQESAEILSIQENETKRIFHAPDRESVSPISNTSPLNTSWVCPPSTKCLRTYNPIRAIVDPVVSNSIKSGELRGDGKDQISLALGDPTAFGNITPCPAVIDAITKALQSPSMAAGYINACGTPEALAAIAAHHSCDEPNTMVRVTPEDVVVANGASGALELALTALLDEDSVLLVPNPGFPLYQVIAESHGARVMHYNLLPENGWECDLDHMENIIKAEQCHRSGKAVVRGIVVNNPSNPTGAVYSQHHLRGILELAHRYRLPIISDEIYGAMTFGDAVFHPMANVAARMGRSVPVITASGLGKQYLVPGWRLGWIVFHDNNSGSICEVKDGAKRLAQVVLGASHLAQMAIPAALAPTDPVNCQIIETWKTKLYSTIENQANFTCQYLDKCHGLTVIPPQGAMYAMVKINVEMFDGFIKDDVSFMKLLLEEENVMVLPGKAFGLKSNSSSPCDAFRVVFCAPINILSVAFERIAAFCSHHAAT